jgi:hypothetical protein
VALFALSALTTASTRPASPGTVAQMMGVHRHRPDSAAFLPIIQQQTATVCYAPPNEQDVHMLAQMSAQWNFDRISTRVLPKTNLSWHTLDRMGKMPN